MPASSNPSSITIHLDELLAERKMTLTELARRINLTQANLSILKTGKAKAIRFTTLAALCEVLDCQPGDILRHTPTDDDHRFNTVLLTAGDKPIAVIKELRSSMGLELKEAKALLNEAPSVVAAGQSRYEAEALMVRLRRAGARAEVT